MKKSLFAVLLTCSFLSAEAQIPQYIQTIPSGAIVHSTMGPLAAIPGMGSRIQMLYHPAIDFPTAPAGLIDAIYIKSRI